MAMTYAKSTASWDLVGEVGQDKIPGRHGIPGPSWIHSAAPSLAGKRGVTEVSSCARIVTEFYVVRLSL